MALLKEITYQNGTKANYHRIFAIGGTFESEASGGIFTVTIYSYLSNDYRISTPYNPVSQSSSTIELTEAEANTNIRKVAYEKIKQLDEWKDSTDC